MIPAWQPRRRRAPLPPLDRAALMGARVTVRFQDLAVTCRVCNATVNTDGRLRLEVCPVAGSGFQWIESSRVIMAESAGVAHALGLQTKGITTP